MVRKNFLVWLSALTRHVIRKGMSGWWCRGFIAIALDEGDIRDGDKVVLDFRNRKLVERLLPGPARKIHITYGVAHLPGVVALLPERDP